MVTFGERLRAAAADRGRLCVGIDPHPELLESWGLRDDVTGLREFSRTCVTAFADAAALVKPQVAFYERFGSAGYAVLEETIGDLRSAGCLVVSDAKRGDIGSTMAGYATAWLADGSPLLSDAVTVSPYLGVGALRPALELAEETGRGVFVLAATSNPEAVELQSSTGANGRSLAQVIVDEVAGYNAAHASQGQAGNLGVVVGATLAAPPDLSRLNGPVLMPGVGAQGAGAADVDRIAAGVADLAFPNISRALLAAGPEVADLRESLAAAVVDFPGLPR